MRLLWVLLLIFSGFQWQALAQTRERPTGTNAVTRNPQDGGRPAGNRKGTDLAKFADIYKCEGWKSLKATQSGGQRTLNCPLVETNYKGECTKQTPRVLCIGNTQCQLKDEKMAVKLADEQPKDPQYLFTQFEYTAACVSADGRSCPKPTDCVAQDLEQGLWLSDDGQQEKARQILKKPSGVTR